MERYIITVELATINVTWVNELNENHRFWLNCYNSEVMIPWQVSKEACRMLALPSHTECHQDTDLVHLWLCGGDAVQHHLPTPSSIALEHLQSVVYLIVDFVW